MLGLGGTHLFQLSSILTIIPVGRSQLFVRQCLRNRNLITALWPLELEDEFRSRATKGEVLSRGNS